MNELLLDLFLGVKRFPLVIVQFENPVIIPSLNHSSMKEGSICFPPLEAIRFFIFSTIEFPLGCIGLPAGIAWFFLPQLGCLCSHLESCFVVCKPLVFLNYFFPGGCYQIPLCSIF